MAKWKKAWKLAYGQLISGAAWSYMQKIMKAQNAKRLNITSEDLKLAKYKKEIKASDLWHIKDIDMQRLNYVCRTLWAPLDLKAWIYLDKKVWAKFDKWDVLCTLYSDDELKIKLALKMINKETFYKIK